MSEILKDIQGLCAINRVGAIKKGIYANRKDYDMVQNFLQKIAFCISDLNEERDNERSEFPQNLLYKLALATWIVESFYLVKRAVVKNEAIKDYQYEKQEELEEAHAYLCALRSFVLAHPMNTNKHKKYYFDGAIVCIDLYESTADILALLPEQEFQHMDFCGIKERKENEDDYYMGAYLFKNDSYHRIQIGSKTEYIYEVVRRYVEALYDLDRKLKYSIR